MFRWTSKSSQVLYETDLKSKNLSVFLKLLGRELGNRVEGIRIRFFRKNLAGQPLSKGALGTASLPSFYLQRVRLPFSLLPTPSSILTTLALAPALASTRGASAPADCGVHPPRLPLGYGDDVQLNANVHRGCASTVQGSFHSALTVT